MRLPQTPLLAVRRLGSYSSLPDPSFSDDSLWHALAAHARGERVSFTPEPWVISYDDPTVTPGPAQRLDACLPVARQVEGRGDIRCLASRHRSQ